jgi:hypothetical protein
MVGGISYDVLSPSVRMIHDQHNTSDARNSPLGRKKGLLPLIKLIFTHIYVESDYDQMLQHVIPAKAGIQRLANVCYVYMEGLI